MPNREKAWLSPGGDVSDETGDIYFAGSERLRPLAAVAAFARRARVYGSAVEGAPSAWEIDLADARLTFVLSGARSRGFSGEGGVLVDLVAGDTIIRNAAVGLAGFDVGNGQWFERALPFDVPPAERVHPRLRDARSLVAEGAVHLLDAQDPRRATVRSGTRDYDVVATLETWTCTCEWVTENGMSRGPCKHVLAVLLADTTC
jgi:hypothetical protein